MKTKKGIFSWIGTGVFTIIGIVYFDCAPEFI